MTVKICASVTANNLRDMKQMISSAERNGADLIEVRLDYFKGKYNLKEVRKLTTLPLIATIRPLREGGHFEGSEEERIRLLFSAVDSDFDFIDVELSSKDSEAIIQSMIDSGAETIISSHIFDSTPNLSTLKMIFKRELSTHADICKITTLAKEIKDNLRCLKFVEESSRKARITCICMGQLGIISRLLSPLFGGCFTYASVEKGKESASGQLTVAEMRKFYEILGI